MTKSRPTDFIAHRLSSLLISRLIISRKTSRCHEPQLRIFVLVLPVNFMISFNRDNG